MVELTTRSGQVRLQGGAVAFEWATAEAGSVGEPAAADRYLVHRVDDGVLIAVVGALGHGREAARAADLAIGLMCEAASPQLAETLVFCHEAMRGTRGMVTAMAWLDARGTLGWISVGRVATMLIRQRYGRFGPHAGPKTHAGVVGLRLPPLQESTLEVQANDLLVMGTDAIACDFALDPFPQPELIDVTRRLVETRAVHSTESIMLVGRILIPGRSLQ